MSTCRGRDMSPVFAVLRLQNKLCLLAPDSWNSDSWKELKRSGKKYWQSQVSHSMSNCSLGHMAPFHGFPIVKNASEFPEGEGTTHLTLTFQYVEIISQTIVIQYSPRSSSRLCFCLKLENTVWPTAKPSLCHVYVPPFSYETCA